MKTNSKFQSTGVAIALLMTLGPAATSKAEDLKFISPVGNPLYFEDAAIATEIRPIFIQHYIPSSFITGGGDVRVYAVQLRYALTERLAIIATKDGFIEFNPKLLPHQDGWADLSAGVKYALVKDPDTHLMVTPGIKLELPTGNQRVFQGNGKGVWDLFTSVAKSWGKWEAQCNLGATIPNDFDTKTSMAHYSVQFGYDACKWFKPFVSANAFTVLSKANVLPINVEGSDLINFGSSKAQGQTQAMLGGGFRSELCEKLQLGVSAETGVGNPKGLFETRLTVDVSYRF